VHDSSNTFKLIGLSGSLRQGSANTALLQAIGLVAPANVSFALYSDIGRLPLFNPDLETSLPTIVVQLRAQLCASDAIVIASPEYAHGIPGAFKNALDWVVGSAELGSKPVALLNASGRSVHAQAALAEVIRTMNLSIVDAASVTIPVAGKGYDAARIAGDEAFAQPLRQMLAALSAI